MARTTRDDILQLHAQADNDLDRYLGNLQKLEAIYVKANEEFEGRYDLFFHSIQGFAKTFEIGHCLFLPTGWAYSSQL